MWVFLFFSLFFVSFCCTFGWLSQSYSHYGTHTMYYRNIDSIYSLKYTTEQSGKAFISFFLFWLTVVALEQRQNELKIFQIDFALNSTRFWTFNSFWIELNIFYLFPWFFLFLFFRLGVASISAQCTLFVWMRWWDSAEERREENEQNWIWRFAHESKRVLSQMSIVKIEVGVIDRSTLLFILLILPFSTFFSLFDGLLNESQLTFSYNFYRFSFYWLVSVKLQIRFKNKPSNTRHHFHSFLFIIDT